VRCRSVFSNWWSDCSDCCQPSVARVHPRVLSGRSLKVPRRTTLEYSAQSISESNGRSRRIGSSPLTATDASHQLVYRHDPYLEGQATVALLALLLSGPYTGAHLFDWAVRGTLQKLRAFRLDSLKQDVNALATDEVGRGAYESLDRVMDHFVRAEAFGTISPWVEGSAGSGEPRYEPQRTLDELPEPLFWVCAFLFLGGWRDAFPNSSEATGRDVRTRLFSVFRGVLGLKEKGKAEEQLLVGLHREGLVASSSVTKERITLLQPAADPLLCLKKLYGCG
jgi:hypothetical protein